MKVYIETMGCQMNRLDSELAAGAMRRAGHTLVDSRREADVVIYNTCSVRRHAEQKALSRLGAEGQRKAAGMKPLVVVAGCMAQRMGDDLRRLYPQVDVVCGPGQLHRLEELISSAAASRPVVATDPSRREMLKATGGGNFDELDAARDPDYPAGAPGAFVRVSRGCDYFCSYCVVPFVRGPQMNRPPERILGEIRRLVDAGRTEITLLGQTVNAYKWAEGGSTVRFSDLVASAAAIAGLRRLKFVTSHPVDFGDDLLTAMRDFPNICPYIHAPAQSGSDAVLARMNRGYTRAQYDDLIDRARRIVPNVVLAGDFITGFPGETEADHAASVELIRRSGYKNSFIFRYSPRPGTASAGRMADDVPTEVKKRRNLELLAAQAKASLEHHMQYVGKVVEALVEGPSPKAVKAGKRKTGPGKNPAETGAGGGVQLVGRTAGDHIVAFDGPDNLAGRYINVLVERATHLTLIGRAI